MTGLQHTELATDHGFLCEEDPQQAQSCNHFDYNRDRDGGYCPVCREPMTDHNS